jgi:hypothetical protein
MIRLAHGVDIPVFDDSDKPDPAYFVGIALIRGTANGDALLFSDGINWLG